MLAIFDIDYTLTKKSIVEYALHIKTPGRFSRILRRYDTIEDKMITFLYYLYKIGRKRFWKFIKKAFDKIEYREDTISILKEFDSKNYIIVLLSANPQPIVDIFCNKIYEDLNLNHYPIGFGSLDKCILINKRKSKLLKDLKKISNIYIYFEDYTSKTNSNLCNTISVKEFNLMLYQGTSFYFS
jgi:phosphoserine phosphatase